MNEKVSVALIGAVVSIGVSLITAITQTKATLKDEKPAFIQETREQLAFSVTGVPVGTVVASMIAPKEFARLVGDETNFDTRKSQWVPADGRSVAGSRYASAMTSTVPDLRGLFIRGLNYAEPDKNRLTDQPAWADPEPNRQPGSLQADSVSEHHHSFAGQHQVQTNGSSGFWAISPQNYNGVQSTSNFGGEETRPKNAALFYYIKIN